jgi:hypothetical protein
MARPYETNLSRRFGLDFRLSDLDYPRPGAIGLKDVQLVDPETGRLVAQLDRVKVNRGADAMLISADRLTIASDWLGPLAELVDERILRQAEHLPQTVLLRTAEATLHMPYGEVQLSRVRGELQRLPAGRKASGNFYLVGQQAKEPLQVSMARDHQTGQPTTRLELDTGDTPLPCSLLTPFLPVAESLGEQASFQGRAWLMRTGDDWTGEVAGRLSGIDLARLVPAGSAHHLTGTAQIVIQELHFRATKIYLASGSVSVGPGTVTPSLLRGALEALNLVAHRQSLAESTTPVAFTNLEVGFQIDDSGLTLSGRCQDAPAGTIMADDRGPLLGQPLRQPIPVVSLIRAMVPYGDVQVPATEQTEWLLRLLPLPSLEAIRR